MILLQFAVTLRTQEGGSNEQLNFRFGIEREKSNMFSSLEPLTIALNCIGM